MTATASILKEPPSEMLLPDPPPEPQIYTVISVDDHLVEPPWLFEGRLPAKFVDRAPKIVETDTGALQWEFDNKVYAQLGFNALVGRRDRDDFTVEPARFSDMRRGAWDIHHRIKDMDLSGIWASICFPSQITGFCGRVYSGCSDPELGLAVTRAFNDWIHEEWWGSYPERIVPMGITWLRDAELAAAEIRRNAARGFVAVTLPEQPQNIGLESLHSGWWDPVVAACVETDTVICLHIGSSGSLLPSDPAGPAVGSGATKFQVQAYSACTEWIWSKIPLRFPEVKLAFSEGGVGWVPVMYDRLKHQIEISGHGRSFWSRSGAGGRTSGGARSGQRSGSVDIGPHEALLRNGYFCTINDPSTIDSVLELAPDNVMVETDYPHADSTWPNCQTHLENMLGHLSEESIAKLTHRTAAELFRHPLPEISSLTGDITAGNITTGNITAGNATNSNTIKGK